MADWAAQIVNSIESAIKNKNFKGHKICTITNTNPLIFEYEGTEIGTTKGDTVYVHPLMTFELIKQDENKLYEVQNFKNSTAYNSPQFQAAIEGSLPEFIKEFYLFYKNWQNTYLLNIGDLIAVLELKDNTYLILQKIVVDTIKDEKEEGAEWVLILYLQL